MLDCTRQILFVCSYWPFTLTVGLDLHCRDCHNNFFSRFLCLFLCGLPLQLHKPAGTCGILWPDIYRQLQVLQTGASFFAFPTVGHFKLSTWYPQQCSNVCSCPGWCLHSTAQRNIYGGFCLSRSGLKMSAQVASQSCLTLHLYSCRHSLLS